MLGPDIKLEQLQHSNFGGALECHRKISYYRTLETRCYEASPQLRSLVLHPLLQINNISYLLQPGFAPSCKQLLHMNTQRLATTNIYIQLYISKQKQSGANRITTSLGKKHHTTLSRKRKATAIQWIIQTHSTLSTLQTLLKSKETQATNPPKNTGHHWHAMDCPFRDAQKKELFSPSQSQNQVYF